MGSKNAINLPEDQPEDLPPAYTDYREEEPRSSSARRLFRAHIPLYNDYLPPGSSVSKDQVTNTLTLPDNNDEAEVQRLINVVIHQASLPPKPVVRIKGFRHSGEGGTDFDIRINMTRMFVGDLHYRIFPDDIQSVSTDEASLQQTFAKFRNDRAKYKTLILDRQACSWDVTFLHQKLRALVEAINYDGNVEITFPSLYSRVVLQNKALQLQRQQINPVSFLKSYFGKQSAQNNRNVSEHHAVKSFWPYASAPRGDVNRLCAVQSEEVWLQEWQGVIKHALLNRHRGWLTDDDQLEWQATSLRTSSTWLKWAFGT